MEKIIFIILKYKIFIFITLLIIVIIVIIRLLLSKIKSKKPLNSNTNTLTVKEMRAQKFTKKLFNPNKKIDHTADLAILYKAILKHLRKMNFRSRIIPDLTIEKIMKTNPEIKSIVTKLLESNKDPNLDIIKLANDYIALECSRVVIIM